MTIREVLDGIDREQKQLQASIIRLGEIRQRILSCCREEKAAERAEESACRSHRTTTRRRAA